MIRIEGKRLEEASREGMDRFLAVFVEAYRQALGGGLGKDNMQVLNASQHTLYAYSVLRDELMEGGFCQLIQNGWGGYIFHNPMARVLREWGLEELSKILYRAREIYDRNRTELERERTDEEFMAMYEQWDVFESLEERFIENEEQYTALLACYVDDHIGAFAQVI